MLLATVESHTRFITHSWLQGSHDCPSQAQGLPYTILVYSPMIPGVLVIISTTTFFQTQQAAAASSIQHFPHACLLVVVLATRSNPNSNWKVSHINVIALDKAEKDSPGFVQDILRRTRVAKRKDIAAFVELHIEQGSLLEKESLQLGIVTAIAAPAALRVHFKGGGGHAGALLMPDRWPLQNLFSSAQQGESL